MDVLTKWIKIFLAALVLFGLTKGILWVNRQLEEKRILKQVIERLSSDSRIAEVLVTQSVLNEQTRTIETTIKFLEYDSKGKPLPARYFKFEGNIIQFQTLVIRFDDKLVAAGDKLRGKSACLFLKAFVLNGAKTQEFDITPINEIPLGYKVPGLDNQFERELWKEFWAYALEPSRREKMGIKNAQIEAPGSMFLPGTIYTMKVEHDGGIRIDAKPLPEIVKGEKL